VPRGTRGVVSNHSIDHFPGWEKVPVGKTDQGPSRAVREGAKVDPRTEPKEQPDPPVQE